MTRCERSSERGNRLVQFPFIFCDHCPHGPRIHGILSTWRTPFSPIPAAVAKNICASRGRPPLGIGAHGAALANGVLAARHAGHVPRFHDPAEQSCPPLVLCVSDREGAVYASPRRRPDRHAHRRELSKDSQSFALDDSAPRVFGASARCSCVQCPRRISSSMSFQRSQWFNSRAAADPPSPPLTPTVVPHGASP